MYAVIETGGKQYQINVGDTIFIEKIAAVAEDAIVFDKVIAIGGDGNFSVGTPYVSGATVNAKVISQTKGKKVLVFKYKSKKGYKKMKGHRQPYTKLKIEAINA